jgi:hypothetical protein
VTRTEEIVTDVDVHHHETSMSTSSAAATGTAAATASSSARTAGGTTVRCGLIPIPLLSSLFQVNIRGPAAAGRTATHEELDRGESIAEFSNSRGEWQQPHRDRGERPFDQNIGATSFGHFGGERHNAAFATAEDRSLGGELIADEMTTTTMAAGAGAATGIYDKTTSVSQFGKLGEDNCQMPINNQKGATPTPL